jgi:hypothetical protein
MLTMPIGMYKRTMPNKVRPTYEARGTAEIDQAYPVCQSAYQTPDDSMRFGRTCIVVQEVESQHLERVVSATTPVCRNPVSEIIVTDAAAEKDQDQVD